MAPKKSGNGLLRFLIDLQTNDSVQRQAIALAPLAAHLVMLRTWQTQRLASTYADLLENPQYAQACQFFLSDIYSNRDFRQRDADAERLHELLTNFLPANMLRLLTSTLRLNRLSNQLDQQLAQVLVEDLGLGSGSVNEISAQMYAQGYRICNNYAERKYQIDLLVNVLEEAIEGSRSALVGITLRAAQRPARHAGWQELHDFLERGYLACKPVREIDGFVNTIRQRELEILEAIFAKR